MDEKPELIAFSQYMIGGVPSYYSMLLSHDKENEFDKKCIYFLDRNFISGRPTKEHCNYEEFIFEVSRPEYKSFYTLARNLEKLVSERPGVLMCNFRYELVTLHLYRRSLKTIYFICHDKDYLANAIEFEFLIDVFIAHNIFFYHELIRLFPKRKDDVFFLPYGIQISGKVRSKNSGSLLRIIVLCRMVREKGVWDIPEIDQGLKEINIHVEWMMVGDGPEQKSLHEMLSPRGNFAFYSPAENREVIDLASKNDIFVLPSQLDGLPVALLETMSVGCVPVISEFNSGINAVVTPEIGYVLPVGKNEEFVKAIEFLHLNRQVLEKKSQAAMTKIKLEFDVAARTKDYYLLFRRYKELKKRNRFRLHKYGGWLDYPFIPRIVRDTIRRIIWK